MSQRPKTLSAAYFWWLCLGFLGAHRFYLRRWRSGVAYVLLVLLTFAALFVFLAAVPLFFLIIFLLIDAVLLPRFVRRANAMPTATER